MIVVIIFFECHSLSDGNRDTSDSNMTLMGKYIISPYFHIFIIWI